MIRLDNISVTSGNFCLDGASMTVPTGKYGVLMGRTGSGKTTLLEAMAGLKHVSDGKIFLGDREVTHSKPAERNLGYVPQDGALFSTMTVRDQIGFALRIRRQTEAKIKKRVDQLAELLGISDLLSRSILGLSGGERQRVALGRALSFRPTTLLLDEPLSALDDETRWQMYEILKNIQTQTGVTTLHVTHSLEESTHLADILFRIENGRICVRPINESSFPPDAAPKKSHP